jgi:ElaB/YqjD/DUF883 family membrane-anchored ribosome-binding protein
MNAKIATAASQASEDLRALLRDAELALSGAGEVADEKVQLLRSRLRAALDKGGETYDQAREVVREKLHDADGYVRAHPYQAIGTALAVGAIVGLLIGSRRS